MALAGRGLVPDQSFIINEDAEIDSYKNYNEITGSVGTSIIDELKRTKKDYQKQLKEAVDTHKKETTEKVDGYLNYVVEEWVKENELAVEKGIRSELVEDFMTGLKNLFTEHYIDIPDEKVDLVDDLFEKVEDLEKQLDETVNNSVEMKKELAEYKKQETLREDMTILFSQMAELANK